MLARLSSPGGVCLPVLPQVGKQCAAVDDGRNVTLGGVVDFACEADYQIYAKHAAHVAVIKKHVLPHLSPGGRTALQMAL
jgi:hypothetical protein